MEERIAVIGLGYVGLPLALALAKKFPGTIGFDINYEKCEFLKRGIDIKDEFSHATIKESPLEITNDLIDLKSANFFIVAVPTPIDQYHRPDLNPLISASEMIAKVLPRGAIVVYESTVYPGVTEEICGSTLAKTSGLRQGIDFKLGYSPERINPGDHEHTLEKIVKVVSAEDSEALERVAKVYEAIIEAGIYRAPSIKIAEAAKVVENIQRDVNIALMNELALIFDRCSIRTVDVLATANTKWNFLPFKPGLVGGHCIGVDPFYMIAFAEKLGYHSELILAGRHINHNMGVYVAQRVIKLLTLNGNTPLKNSRVGILGLTFKENVRDLRNTRVADIVMELKQYGIEPLVHDPLIDPYEAKHEYGIDMADWNELSNLDALVLAVMHRHYLEMPQSELLQCLRSDGILIDVKSVLNPAELSPQITYWSL
ncbi:nucleotide sugar dehydrogenase [Nostoc sp. CHAB 5715]|uniref:nucleotide sugar dehydrogenase n=1 Tax=Nostoc sp. CHAB 5715 TaxID=2780400 RepID=UPI001E54E35A|nr:nucleotide sugar dehydrogenase [Nostoc sp. CHAB 5715]MCC5621512.1 nucleotide sugar dehydrogenase [Nostoc sp. CHAB 5715]